MIINDYLKCNRLNNIRNRKKAKKVWFSQWVFFFSIIMIPIPISVVFLAKLPGTNILNQLPVANAGPDQTIAENTTVTLDGIASKDPDGNITSYVWRQISGPDVNLSDSFDFNPVFTAPNMINDTELGFRLIVVNNQNATATDTVNILAKSVREEPPGLRVDQCPVKYRPDKDIISGFRLIVVNNQNASEIPLESTVDECPVKYRPDKYSNNNILSLFYEDYNKYTSNSISRTIKQESNKIE